jgi:plastocyanin
MSKLPLTLLATIALTIGLAACGSSSRSSSQAAAAASTPAATTTAATTASTTASATTPTTATPAATSTSTGAAGAGTTLAISAQPSGQLMFSTDKLSAKAGKVTIVFTNNAPEDHNFTLQSPGGKIVGATPSFMGGSKMLTVTLTAGTYTYFCTEPGHRAAGMQGTLTVS